MDFAASILATNAGAGLYLPMDPRRMLGPDGGHGASPSRTGTHSSDQASLVAHRSRGGGGGRARRAAVSVMPPLFVAFMVKAGGDSGKAHSDVRRRWEGGDPAVVNGMVAMAGMVDAACACLVSRDFEGLGRLMDDNFDLRRSIYTDAVTGAHNLRAVDAARAAGFHAKFTGSGGAFVLLRRGRNGDAASFELDAAAWSRAREALAAVGFELVRARVHVPGAPAARWDVV